MTASSTGDQIESLRVRRRAFGPAAFAVLACLAIAACSGGGGGGGEGEGGSDNGGGGGDANCGAFGNTAPAALGTGDINTILAQAANEAAGRGVTATITIVDRVGNILAVARAPAGAAATTDMVTSAPRTLPGPVTTVPPGPPFTL